MKNKKNRKIWDNIFRKKKTWGQYPSEYLVRDVSNFQIDKKKINLLELGCGPGANFFLYIKENIKFDALDISGIAIKKSKDVIKKTRYKKANLINDDFSYIKKTHKKYDIIIDSASLCYISEKEFKNLLKYIYSSLKKNGIFWSRIFGKKTTGFIKNSNFTIPIKGPIKGHGKTRVVSKNQIKKLYGKIWRKIEIEEVLRTTSKNYVIQEFIIKSIK